MAANQLQQTLDAFRQQLARGEEAFDRWQANFRGVEADMTHRLDRLSRQLGAKTKRPRLRVVTADEIAVL